MLRSVRVQNDKSMVAIFTFKEVPEFRPRDVADYLKAKIMREFCLGEPHVNVFLSNAVDRKLVEYFIWFSPLAITVISSAHENLLGKIENWLDAFSGHYPIKKHITRTVEHYLNDSTGFEIYDETDENWAECPVKGNWK